MAFVPFKTPLDYFNDGLSGDPDNINRWHEIYPTLGWEGFDADLHVYPYTHAIPAMLSMGCRGKCKFCPTYQQFKGKVVRGDPEQILPHYAGKAVHFMDEDFFGNDMELILPLLERLGIKWLAMSTYQNLARVVETYGEQRLWNAGLRCVEVGLENVALMKKAGDAIPCKQIPVYYLNMTCFEGETKETIQENANWMRERSLRNPIHFNNGVWYAPGQFLHLYGSEPKQGIVTDSSWARTRPTFIPNSLLNQDFKVDNLEQANYFSQLVYGLKMFPEKLQGNIREFIGVDHKKATWLIVGIRCGAII